MELLNIGMSESLLCSKSLVRIELQEALKKVQSIIRSGREDVSETLGFSWRERLEHGLG